MSNSWHSVADFFVPMRPTPWKRAGKNGKRHFTDPEMLKAKLLIQNYMIREKVQRQIKDLISMPVKLDLVFYFKRPKRVNGEHLEHFPAKTPDDDNLGKLVRDAGNGVLWLDDALVVDSHLKKVYGEPEGVQITIGVFDGIN